MRERWPSDLVAAATEQADLRRRAAPKFSRADRMLFTRAGLEQASSERTARHRAGRFTAADGTVLDLCCGIGGDLAALGEAAGEVIGVDRDEAHAIAARHNARQYDVPATVVVADVRDVHAAQAAAAFIDPARRRTSGGTDRRGGSDPPLTWCLEIPAPYIAIKAAPGLDLAGIPIGWEVEFVAVGRDLKEAVLWSPAWAQGSRRATVLHENATATMLADHTRPAADVRPPGAFLLDPSPAVTRAGAVVDLAAELEAWQVDPRIAFLSSDRPLRSAFGRGLVVEASLPFGVKPLAAELRRLDVGAVDIRRRGLAGDVDDLRRRLRPTGERRATVILTRVVNKPWTFVCTDLPDA